MARSASVSDALDGTRRSGVGPGWQASTRGVGGSPETTKAGAPASMSSPTWRNMTRGSPSVSNNARGKISNSPGSTAPVGRARRRRAQWTRRPSSWPPVTTSEAVGSARCSTSDRLTEGTLVAAPIGLIILYRIHDKLVARTHSRVPAREDSGGQAPPLREDSGRDQPVKRGLRATVARSRCWNAR